MVVNVFRGGAGKLSNSTAVEELKRVPLFRDLPARSLERIAASAAPVSYRTGEVVFRQGDPGVSFFVVLGGRVSVALGGKDVAQLPAGGFFGEMSLLDDCPRSATVTAAQDTHCLEVKRTDFMRELRSQPDVALQIMATLSKRIRDLDARVRQLQGAIPDEWLT